MRGIRKLFLFEMENEAYINIIIEKLPITYHS